jgi:PleD family two-component response regulator
MFAGSNQTLEDCLQEADQALYLAKAGGRNQVVLFEGTNPE